MKRIAFACLFAASFGAQAVEFNQPVIAKSQVSFVSKQMGVPVDGQFRRFNAQLAFDPAKPAAAHATIEIDLASIDTGSKEADEEVVGKNWFAVKSYPTAKFVSSAIKPLGNGRYEVSGQMTLKGRTRPLVAPVSFRQDGANGVFDGSFVLKRLDYAIGEGPWGDTDTVANEIQVKFHIVAAAAKK